jgi:hypothetical protein
LDEEVEALSEEEEEVMKNRFRGAVLRSYARLSLSQEEADGAAEDAEEEEEVMKARLLRDAATATRAATAATAATATTHADGFREEDAKEVHLLRELERMFLQQHARTPDEEERFSELLQALDLEDIEKLSLKYSPPPPPPERDTPHPDMFGGTDDVMDEREESSPRGGPGGSTGAGGRADMFGGGICVSTTHAAPQATPPPRERDHPPPRGTPPLCRSDLASDEGERVQAILNADASEGGEAGEAGREGEENVEEDRQASEYERRLKGMSCILKGKDRTAADGAESRFPRGWGSVSFAVRSILAEPPLLADGAADDGAAEEAREVPLLPLNALEMRKTLTRRASSSSSGMPSAALTYANVC